MIEVKNIQKKFGDKVVIENVSAEMKPGQCNLIIGASGSGKTVLMKCMVGLLTPDQGEICYHGENFFSMNHEQRTNIRKEIGMLFQGAALFDSLKVWENVAFALIQGRGMGRTQAKEIALSKLAKVGLGPEVGELSPSELSGGMQKRVGLARAIAAEPEIIFFDEPTTGLDPIMADVINDLIVATVKDLGVTTMSITHDMASARKIADKVAMIYKGKIIWSGRKEDIDNSGNPYVDQFIHGRAEGPIKMEVAR